MANKNFIVQNGLTVGAVTIDATSGNITTTGVLTSTNSTYPAEFQGNLSVGDTLTLNGLALTASPGGSTVSIDPTFSGGPWRTNYSTGPYTLGLWFASASDAAYIAAAAATAGSIVSFAISSTEYRGVVSSVATSTNSFYGPTAYVVTFTLSGAAPGYTLPGSSGTPDNSPVSLITSGTAELTVSGDLAADAGTFTTLTADSLDVAGGGLNGVAIGASTASTGAFTTLTASGITTVTNTTETTSTSTGALTVSGGAAISGNAYVANNLYIGSTSFGKSLTTPTIIAVDNGSNYAQIAMINSSGNGSADFAAYADNGTDSAGWVDVGIAGSTFSDSNYDITKPHDGYLITKPLNNSYGGNLVIGTSDLGTHKDIVIGVGGFSASSEVARFHGNVSTSGSLEIKYTTPSTSTTTGALVVTGGVGVGGDVRVAGNIYAASLNTVTSSQLNVTAPLVYLEGNAYPYTFDIGLYSHFVGGPANVYTHTGAVRSYQNGYWGFFSNVKSEPTGTVNWTDAGLIWDTVKVGGVTIANATAASSTTSGALTVAGGAGIAGAVYVGGNGTNALVHTGHIIPSSNVAYNLGSSTAWYGTYYGVATQAKYADLAENYQADGDYAPGQVLMFGGSKEVTIADANTRAVAGVVSTNPAHLMNGQLRGSQVVALALQGRVPCNVIGPVKKGDLMISAGFGYAKSHNMPEIGQVIGKALEDFNGTKGVIEVVVGRV